MRRLLIGLIALACVGCTTPTRSHPRVGVGLNAGGQEALGVGVDLGTYCTGDGCSVPEGGPAGSTFPWGPVALGAGSVIVVLGAFAYGSRKKGA